MNNELHERLIAEADAKLNTVVTRTREDGSTYQYRPSDASATEGDFQIYVIPVERRTTARRNHLRVTYYLRQGERFVRVSKAAWMAALAEAERG